LLSPAILGEKGLLRASLLRKYVNYGRKKFYNTGPRSQNEA